MIKRSTYRFIDKSINTKFGKQTSHSLVVDIYQGNTLILTSDALNDKDAFLENVKAICPCLLKECQERFRNNGPLLSELSEKEKRNLKR